jgi:hypothetical protein
VRSVPCAPPLQQDIFSTTATAAIQCPTPAALALADVGDSVPEPVNISCRFRSITSAESLNTNHRQLPPKLFLAMCWIHPEHRKEKVQEEH